MNGAPGIWLAYRPIRIGWIVSERSLEQLERAATWSTVLWGGGFNPVIPLHDVELSRNLIHTFGVDILIPIKSDPEIERFKENFSHLLTPYWAQRVFEGDRCHFVDIRHAVGRVSEQIRSRVNTSPPKFLQLSWADDDPMSPLLHVLFGKYPEPNEVGGVNYIKGINTSLKTEQLQVEREAELNPDLLSSVSPLDLTRSRIVLNRESFLGRLNPGIVLGNATDFDDLVLLWNLRAAGAKVLLYDRDHVSQLRSLLKTFLESVRTSAGGRAQINMWSRSEQFDSDLDLTGIEEVRNHADSEVWNGLNVRPPTPSFSLSHRDVVPSYEEVKDGATASFALPGQPFYEEGAQAYAQHFVVTVEASRYGPAQDDVTFSTPFLPKLNEFYGRNFHFNYAEARSERGFLGRGAVGIFENVGSQQMQVRALRVQDFIRTLFDSVGIAVTRSDPPGLLCARLIRQLGGVQGCRVLKVRGARELIEKYGPDQSFTRSGAEMLIGNCDPHTGKPRFLDFEDLYIEPREGGKLRPAAVFDYLVSCGVFRVGLEFKCPNCELKNWITLDDVRTLSTCAYCGHHFDATRQLKDRDWRYRRSGLFGRDDHQEGSIPVALSIQQMDTTLRDSMLMYSTALKFRSETVDIEECEADFLAVFASERHLDESPLQIIVGEAKTRKKIDADDARKLAKLAKAIPPEIAKTFIMFSKTDVFCGEEVDIAKSLRQRVILWSRDELEPYSVYERSKDRIARPYAISLNDMADITYKLYFQRP